MGGTGGVGCLFDSFFFVLFYLTLFNYLYVFGVSVSREDRHPF